MSIGALRHYAEIGLFEPAEVDPATGYRYYREDQLPTARRIAALRDLDVPLAVIKQVRDLPTERLSERLAAYREDIESIIWRLQRQSHRLSHFTEDRMPTTAFTLDPDDERRLAATLFNRVWELLERTGRGRDEDDEMLHAAHASRYHWGVVGEPVNRARGEWQVSRVYAVLGRAEPALHHGRRCLELVEEHGLSSFDLAYAHEAIARAHRVAGERDQTRRHVELARVATDKVTDPEERNLLDADLAQLD
ncbi:hypothetical protein Raf01_55540 [Rugosimonospora africana]|uniref:HTH merR-type domain-containing protein n=1 Tax=Rugosimonospora africana TaxID=556532 RepID=A0A8J3VSK5_9ACTN|nr:hypothetical protein Raf01_55540 [Rugosimonospora africana]